MKIHTHFVVNYKTVHDKEKYLVPSAKNVKKYIIIKTNAVRFLPKGFFSLPDFLNILYAHFAIF